MDYHPLASYLVNESASAGNGLDVVALQDKLVLHIIGALDLGVLKHVDVANPLLPKEVADLQVLAAVGDGGVDGEMGVHETHRVTETLGDAGHHVAHVGQYGANASKSLGLAKPHLDLSPKKAQDPFSERSGSTFAVSPRRNFD
eukprot:3832132-Pyramimonas_sp.AAC.1